MKKFYNNMHRYKSYMFYSAFASLRADVSDSYFNWLWWILDPLLFMLVYTFVTLIVFGRSEPHLIPFIFVGYSAWSFGSRCINQSVKLVRSNKSILSRVYLPKYVLLGSMIIENSVRYLIMIALSFIIAAIDHVHFSLQVLWLPVLILSMILFLFGSCCILMHLGVYMKDMSNIITVVMKLIFYLSGVFFNLEKRVPAPYGRLLMNLNPFALYMNEMRRVVLYEQTPRLKVIGLWIVISFVLSAIGISFIHRYEQTYVKAI